jgi:radical SAM superfamily enzyme YgiQ (UPF0313 family)
MKKRILMVYPEIPPTYWSYKYALPFLGYRATMPPLGLITIAAMLPDHYEVRLLDMNIDRLKREDIIDADIVFISAMIIQKDSFQKVVEICNECGTPVAAGGPYPTSSYQNIQGVDYFILNEGEMTLPRFIHDLERGDPKHIYLDTTKPDITKTPPPRYDLLDISAYATMAVQSSRGCPFNCEFCDIIEMFGRVPRYKDPVQLTREFDRLYETGYRGAVFIVDDNFIGNKKMVRKILEHIIAWQKEKNQPFALFTEASINLAQDDPLMDKMVAAGFNMVFVGIETPVQETLALTQKQQNTKADILESIKKIQSKGLEVSGGFIVGFDSDPENIFDLQIKFIQNAAIPVAMIGTLVALPSTQLYRRLEREGRILCDASGNNTHTVELNFTTKMAKETLLAGYKRVISTIYTPKHFLKRVRTLLKRIPNQKFSSRSIQKNDIKAFILSLMKQTFSSYGIHYIRLLLSAIVHNPRNFPLAVNLAVKGYHFFKMTNNILKIDKIYSFMNSTLEKLEEQISIRFNREGFLDPVIISRLAAKAKNNINRLYKKLTPELKEHLNDAYRDFKIRCENMAHSWIQRDASNDNAMMDSA